jgi:hypothetical protein
MSQLDNKEKHMQITFDEIIKSPANMQMSAKVHIRNEKVVPTTTEMDQLEL